MRNALIKFSVMIPWRRFLEENNRLDDSLIEAQSALDVAQ